MAKALVLGANGNFGRHMARELAVSGWDVVSWSRGSDMAAAAKGAALIVNGLNPPMYHDWARLIPQITESVIHAANASGARVLVPGNVYNFGTAPGPWGPDTPQHPTSRKGAIRVAMEARYRASGIAATVLRGGDFLDPAAAVSNFGMALKKARKGQIEVMGPVDVPRAYAWLPDMARAGAALAGMTEALPRFADVPFAGLTVTMADLLAEASQQLGRDLRVARFPWWLMTLASPFWELARELREMRYLYNTPHSLDPAPMAALLPGFRLTPLSEVTAAYLAHPGVR
jgi:nucleoside-diphosphate-sugar epimerase